jgi:hypothetical protein
VRNRLRIKIIHSTLTISLSTYFFKALQPAGGTFLAFKNAAVEHWVYTCGEPASFIREEAAGMTVQQWLSSPGRDNFSLRAFLFWRGCFACVRRRQVTWRMTSAR